MSNFEEYYRLTADIEEEGLRRVEALSESDPDYIAKLDEIQVWLSGELKPFLHLIND